jgi:acyl-CoA thioester hydrolase
MTVAFSIPVRVYYEDTDAGGVVYYANYLRYMERCRSDWLRSVGLEIRDLAARFGVLFAVRAANVEYIKPAQLSDLLTVSVLVAKFGRVSLDLDQLIHRGDDLVCQGRIRLAGIDAETFLPKPFPDELTNELTTWKTP